MRKALFILGELSDGDMDWLAEAGQRQEIAPDSILIQRGEPNADVYILLDGRLSVRIDGRDSQEINALLPGEFIGELSFLDSRPPSATVIASTNSVVAAISRDQLETKLRDDTAFAARFYRALGVFLAHRLRRLTLQGAAEPGSEAQSADEMADDEIDPRLLESISLAGKRFEWFQSRFGIA
ncbi:MAG: cyclic nucleotide-binding domain-containing protein [Planctomycetes bacterium]|nr:cyclic nucleotide-binding domain-containing protein [Planctomycetota bacterium]